MYGGTKSRGELKSRPESIATTDPGYLEEIHGQVE